MSSAARFGWTASPTARRTQRDHAQDTSAILGVALSADGRLLASGSGDGTVKLWGTDSGMRVGRLRSESCYERLDITGMTGVTAAQRTALLTLGAVDRARL